MMEILDCDDNSLSNDGERGEGASYRAGKEGMAGSTLQLQALLHHQKWYCYSDLELAEKVAEIDETHSLFRGECLVNQAVSFELSHELLATRCKKVPGFAVSSSSLS